MTQKEIPAYRITDLHESERPRERLKSLGPEALSNAELLAILLRTGLPGENVIQIGQRLLQTFGGLSGLHRVPFEELCAQRGVGAAKAAQIKAAIELGRRLNQKGEDTRPVISDPESAAELISYEMSALEQEHLRVLLLNTRNRLLDICEIYRGSVNSAQVRVAEVFRDAVRRNATAIIVAHNHPSGDPTPSPDDIALTRSLIQAGKLLGIEVIDHLIIGRSRFVSLKREGLI